MASNSEIVTNSANLTTTPLQEVIVYYHMPCNDGVAGAWCAWKAYNPCPFTNAKYIGCSPGKEIILDEDMVKNKTIYFIDILPTRNIPFICKHAAYVVILDHHITNQEYIKELPLKSFPNLHVVFDLERSGAQIAWDYFNSNYKRPWFINYIGDRDLWTWKLPDSKAVNTGLQNNGYLDSIEQVNAFYTKVRDISDDIAIKQCADSGYAVESYQKRVLDQASKKSVLLNFNDPVSGINTQCWAGTINPELISDLGNILAERELPNGTQPLFSVIYSYYILSDEYGLSLRSSNTSATAADVSKIAKNIDAQGGGHKHAAGCKANSSQFWKYFSKPS